MSLRARVLVAFSAIALISIAVAVIVTATTTSYLMNQIDARLQTFAGPRALGDDDHAQSDESEDDGDDVVIAERPSDVWRAYVDSNGKITVIFAPNVGEDQGVPVITADDLPRRGSATFTVPSSTGGADYRVYARAQRGGVDITALSLEEVTETTRRLIAIQLAGIVAILGVLGVVAWWVIRLGVNPMRRMVDASTAIAEGDLSVRLDGAGGGSESAELAASLNTMIERLTASLEERERSEARLREFVADASHELRTPLTTVLGYAELYRRGALTRKADAADAWARTEAEASRMKRLVNDMLELSKYDAEPVLERREVDLLALCGEIARDALLGHPEASVTVTVKAPQSWATVTGCARPSSTWWRMRCNTAATLLW